MALETIEDCLDLLATFGKPQKGKLLKVNFYGGEPMLAFHRLRAFVERGESRGLKFGWGIVTNGTVGTAEQAEWIKRHRGGMQRSIDGGPEALAISRPGALERYRANMEIFGDERGTRRGTVAPETAKYLLRSIRFLHEELGVEKGGAFIPDAYSTWSPRQESELMHSLWEIGEDFVSDFRQGKHWRFHWFDKPIAALGGKSCSVHCGAGRGLHAVSWDGFLFPCHRFCSEPRDGECCAGSLAQVLGGSARGYGPVIQRRLSHARTGWRPPTCDGCTARSSCPGGCAHENFKAGASIDQPPPMQCRIRRECVKIVAWMDGQLREEFPDWRASYGQRRSGARRATSPVVLV